MLAQSNSETLQSSVSTKTLPSRNKKVKTKGNLRKKESEKLSGIPSEYSPKKTNTTVTINTDTTEATLNFKNTSSIHMEEENNDISEKIQEESNIMTKEGGKVVIVSSNGDGNGGIEKGLPIFPTEQIMKATVTEVSNTGIEDVLLLDKENESMQENVVMRPETSPETTLQPEDPNALPSAMLAFKNEQDGNIKTKTNSNENIKQSKVNVLDETKDHKAKTRCFCFF